MLISIQVESELWAERQCQWDEAELSKGEGSESISHDEAAAINQSSLRTLYDI
jgi:hypothetical protein